MKPWRWTADRVHVPLTGYTIRLLDGRDRVRAEVHARGVGDVLWHTFDRHGVGGENEACATIDAAKRHAVASLVRQGWAPGGWTVQW